MQRIYFDYASTTPMDPLVIEAMRPYFGDQFGNPSSPHAFGRDAKKAVEDARQTVAQAIGAYPDEIIFNSGGTEGNNHVLLGIAQSYKANGLLKGGHIVISAVEHPSVYKPAEYLVREGFKVTYLEASREGMVDPAQVCRVLTDETILLAVMHANNEIGTIEPVAEIGEIAREKGVPFLVDAVQTSGHIPVNVEALKADFLTISAHKLYGPKGVGALYVRRGTKLPSLILGGDQERGYRASTQNVAGIVGLAKAFELCLLNMAQEMILQIRLRDKLLMEIPQRISRVVINGHRTSRLPNNVHCAFEGVSGESLLMSLDMAGMAASMGSACSSGAMESSRVLRAIGLSDDLVHGALRITLGRWTREEQVDDLLEQLIIVVSNLRI